MCVLLFIEHEGEEVELVKRLVIAVNCFSEREEANDDEEFDENTQDNSTGYSVTRLEREVGERVQQRQRGVAPIPIDNPVPALRRESDA